MMIESMRFYCVVLVAAVVAVALFLHIYKQRQPRADNNTQTQSCAPGTCRSVAHSSFELDPVNEPSYNVREVLKNTLLIEQHLSEKRKYCKACLVKHFLLSEALLDEAIWMAGQSVGTYPKLAESQTFYRLLYDTWHSNMDDDTVRLATLDKLRAWRRDMIDAYM